MTARLVRTVLLVLIVYVGLLGLTTWRLIDTPSGFIPDQDQGYLIGVIQLPAGSSLERTNAVMTSAREIIEKNRGGRRHRGLLRAGRDQFLVRFERRDHLRASE